MNTYIALLRGINVSGQKKIKMADLKIALEQLGFTEVTTYIQSGNIVFKYVKTHHDELSKRIHDKIDAHFGFDVPVLVITPQTLNSIYKKNPFLDRITKGEIAENKMFFTLLKNAPDTIAAQELSDTSYGEEEFLITENVVYFYAANGYGKTKLNNNFFEKKLKSSATTRNLKTVVKLMELSKL